MLTCFIWDQRNRYIKLQRKALIGPDVPDTGYDNYLHPSLREQDWTRKANRMCKRHGKRGPNKPRRKDHFHSLKETMTCFA